MTCSNRSSHPDEMYCYKSCSTVVMQLSTAALSFTAGGFTISGPMALHLEAPGGGTQGLLHRLARGGAGAAQPAAQQAAARQAAADAAAQQAAVESAAHGCAANRAAEAVQQAQQRIAAAAQAAGHAAQSLWQQLGAAAGSIAAGPVSAATVAAAVLAAAALLLLAARLWRGMQRVGLCTAVRDVIRRCD